MWLWVSIAMASEFRAVVDQQRIEADIRWLSGADAYQGAALISRHVDHPDHDTARDALLERLRSIDRLQVRTQPFEAEGRDWLQNAIADLPGSDPTAPMLVIGAHYDSTGKADVGWVGTDDPAPGADDDASGVAAVLELARVLSERQWERTIRFALFDSEEQGLHGSVALARQMAADGEDVALMWSLDPIGYNANDAGLFWVTYDERWEEPGIELADLALDHAPELDPTALERSLIGGATRSDHASFWDEGYPALHVASWPQPPSYHTMDDTMDNVDPAFTWAVASLVAEQAALIAIPVAEAPEEAAGCGCAHGSGPSGFLAWLPLIALCGSRGSSHD